MVICGGFYGDLWRCYGDSWRFQGKQIGAKHASFSGFHHGDFIKKDDCLVEISCDNNENLT